MGWWGGGGRCGGEVGFLTFGQVCDWNFYDPTYSYFPQISKYIPIHIFVCKKTLFTYYYEEQVTYQSVLSAKTMN